AEHEKLIEKHADMNGVGKIKVRWLVPAKTGTAELLAGGNVDFAAFELGAFVAAWDQRTGTPQELRAVAAVEQMPSVLVVRNAARCARPPDSDLKIADKDGHPVMAAIDVADPHTTTVLSAAKKVHDATPRLCSAVVDALDEADKLIKDNPGQAADMYVAMVKD